MSMVWVAIKLASLSSLSTNSELRSRLALHKRHVDSFDRILPPFKSKRHPRRAGAALWPTPATGRDSVAVCHGDVNDVRPIGILDVEACTTVQHVSIADLASLDGFCSTRPGSTLMERISVCAEDEDVTSLLLTAVSDLMNCGRIRSHDIGAIHVGSTSIFDRSKSLEERIDGPFTACEFCRCRGC